MAIPDHVRRMVRASAGYLLNTIILLIVLNIGLAVYFHIRDAYFARRPDRVFQNNPELRGVRENLQKAYPSMTEAEAIRLLSETWERPFVLQWFTEFGEKPYRGKYVNVSDYGFRVGANQGPWPPAHKGNLVVFLFGGSTTFGYGVTDDEALGSRLQLLLAKELGRPVTVYNFGQAMYYSTQERLLFEKLIMSGQRPDLAIFVDGLNEFHDADSEMPFVPPWWNGNRASPPESKTWRAWLRSGIEMLPMTELAVSVRQKVQSAAHWKRPDQTAGQNPKLDEPGPLLKVIDRVFLNERLIEGEAAQYSIRTLFIWQPVPTYGYDLKYHLFAPDGFEGWSFTKFGYPLMREAVTQTRPDNFLWCADIQKDAHEELYVDMVHYSPKMNDMVASCIADGVK